jgi:hypothetical protein
MLPPAAAFLHLHEQGCYCLATNNVTNSICVSCQGSLMTTSMQTFVAVILGAFLAALGGFAATQLNIRIDRSRRAKDAALLSGEILAGVATLLRLAEEASLQGSFLDPLSSRLLSFARREIDVYDRNRELLFSLADSALRARLHSFIVRLSIPLDRLADDLPRYKELCSTNPTSSQLAAELQKEMQATFNYLMESRKMIPELLALLQPLARNKFDTYSRIDSDGILVDKSL